jgi:uracil-DNA glycosylase
VKHFAFEERGKRRIHRTPRYSEIIACRPWLDVELAAIMPQIVVCLGASAAKTLFGSQFRLTEQRGKFLLSPYSKQTLVTYHPSAILRAESEQSSNELYRLMIRDLLLVAQALNGESSERAAG